MFGSSKLLSLPLVSMKVIDYKVGRIVKIEYLHQYFEGQLISQPNKIINPDYSPNKVQVETVFEDVRKKTFPNMPSRMNSLFVFPLTERYTQEWLNTMYPKLNVGYIFLTLILNGDLYWFDADYYNDSLFLDDINDIKSYALNYWKSIDNYSDLPLIEGLFIGNAIVENIEVKYHYGNEGETIYL